MKLQELRKEKHVSQQQLAKDLGVSRSTVAMWEAGTEPNHATLLKLADYFSVSVDYLLERESEGKADAEIWELREELRRRPGLRLLFSASKQATEDDLKVAVKIIEALKGDESSYVD